MSSVISLIKSNLEQNKNCKLFAKTLTKYRHTSKSTEKSKKSDFQLTHSTRFSDNLTIASMKSFAPIKQEKKSLVFLNYNNFHTQYILNKNKKNAILLKMYNLHKYTQNNKSRNFSYNIKLQKNQKNYINTSKKNLKKANFCMKNSLSEKYFAPNNQKREFIYRYYNNSNGVISSSNYSKTSFDFFQKPLDMKRINNFTLYKGRNLETIDDFLAYPSFKSYMFLINKREESVNEFKYKTRIIAKGNYLTKINSNNYDKKLEAIDYDIKKQVLSENSINKFIKLFKSFNSTRDNYNKYLLRIYSDLREKSESLSQQKLNLFMEIERIKQKFNKYINILKECYSIKYFLTCVKNHTLLPHNFTKEDLEDLENDKLKFKPDYYTSKKYKVGEMSNFTGHGNKPKTKNSRPKQISKSISNKVFKRQFTMTNIKLKKNSKNPLKKKSSDKNLCLFENMISVEEFFDHLERINIKMYNLLKNNLEVQSSISQLQKEYEITIKLSENHQKYILNTKKNIELAKKELNILKNKNDKLNMRYDALKDNKFKRDCGVILVRKNIEKIYKNIKKNYEIEKVPSISNAAFNRGKFLLKLIESFYIKIVDVVNEDKQKYPLKYIKLKLAIDDKKKLEASINFQKILAQAIQIKVDNVLIKAAKIIYPKNRRIENYLKYYKKKTKNKETYRDDDKNFLFKEFSESIEN